MSEHRVATTASSVPLPIDPDSHSERLVDERNVFFAYKIFLIPSGLLLACGRSGFRGCGYGYIYKTRRDRDFRQLHRCMLHAYPNVPHSSTMFGISGHTSASMPVIVIHSFFHSTTADWGQTRTRRGQRPSTVRNQQTSPKTVQRTLTQ